ncbi:TPM domain-containing protein [Desulfofustis limnaeus]|uniref:TPM domain-containing protein n=1 Tax=Desulfofustis limnaeus TaxID=2740163 RepID=A0ABN6LZG6_9BACT|nr:TPM domain-containing protein [Desulfofustis limnaeus]BDD86043.1 hypothetical protein DPPLL_04080 [Desulfofustis limnaeus]
MRRRGLGTWLIVLGLVVCSCSDSHDHQFIEDRAGLLLDGERQRIDAYYRALQTDFAVSCRVIILAEAHEDINHTATELFANLGRETNGARGLLFLIDPIGHQIRVEVGYDLEGMFPDAFVGYLERDQLAPFFQQNRVGTGIEATTELFIARAQRDSAGFSFDPGVELGIGNHYSGGAGARLEVTIGSSPEPPVAAAAARSRYLPGATPEQSLAVYRRVLTEKIKDPQLPLYTQETRRFLADWVVTYAQQDNERRHLEESTIDRIIEAGDRAVIRFPPEERTHPPYFFSRSSSGWEIDLAAMNRILHMNHKNQYHFPSLDHEYRFGFSDWEFDANGFPRAQH